MAKKTLFLTILFVFALSLFGAKAFLSSLNRQPRPATQAKAEEVSVTIIEGWSLNDLGNYLENKGLLQAATFRQAATSFNATGYGLLADKPAKASLEGYVFPDTYRLFKPKNSSDEAFAAELIKKALNNFTEKFTPEMQAQAKKDNMSVFQILTLASIIEKETGRNAITPQQKQALDTERKNVASVFYNRLQAGMPLESDATINYITKKNNPTPTDAELATLSPYNTYLNKGLPPGPICNPSLSSILAALYPAQTDFFFFLHKQPSGEPVFSKTFQEHIDNKNKYLK